jgi:pimeloyl-ACP methyl ester carboxylesterase
VDSPQTQYAKSGNLNIAYQVVGEGPFDLVFVPGSISHVELEWAVPSWARLRQGLAAFTRLIKFDKRGTGMSDRPVGATTFEQRMDDIRAVMDAAGSERAALIGVSEGAPMAVLFAATYPARVTALVLYGGLARTLWAPDYPIGTPRDAYDRSVEEDEGAWGRPGFLEELIAGTMPDADEEERRAVVNVLRYGATPGAADDLDRLNAEIDVRPALPVITVPTVVLHQTEDPWVNVEHGRYLSQQIRGARLVELPGRTHIITGDGVELLLSEVRAFLESAWSGGWTAPEPDRVLATVLFTDIVGSTAKAVELGDRGWRELVEEHHAAIRRELARFRGHEIDTAGDGFFASFDGPARAIRCACAITESVRQFELELRAGLHNGRVRGDERQGRRHRRPHRRPRGVRGESWRGTRPQTVKDLVAGSGITFEERGAAELKGVPGEWKLYAVTDA